MSAVSGEKAPTQRQASGWAWKCPAEEHLDPVSAIGLITDLANHPAELARLIDSDLERLNAKFRDFGGRDT
jgi:hypothetical protein